MLRASLHFGPLSTRAPQNRLAELFIGYEEKKLMASYKVALRRTGQEELPHQLITDYPRWSGPLWGLIARALAISLYGKEALPPAGPVDRRCAYATHLSASLELDDPSRRSVLLGELDIVADHPRGHYTVLVQENILGERGGIFAYGSKRLDHPDMWLRALCAAFTDDVNQLPERPAVILPAVVEIDAQRCFDPASLAEPARSGFVLYAAENRIPKEACGLYAEKHYVKFLNKA